MTMPYEPGTRTGIEAHRLRKVARDAGLDDTALWYDACHLAREADRIDVTALSAMRHLLLELGLHADVDDPATHGTRSERRTA